jgi:hypothetical protein
MSEENCIFSWRGDQDAIVLPSQQAVAVYLNDAGAVVIRQEGMPYDDEDEIIVIQAANAEAVAKAIMACARESLAGIQPIPEPVLLVQASTAKKSGNTSRREPTLPLSGAAE